MPTMRIRRAAEWLGVSDEAVRQLKLEPGSLAVALVNAITVIVETPRAFAD